MCLQTELSTELYEAKNLVFHLLNRTLSNSNLNIFWQYFTSFYITSQYFTLFIIIVVIIIVIVIIIITQREII